MKTIRAFGTSLLVFVISLPLFSRHGIVTQASYRKARGQITFAGGAAFCTPQPSCATSMSTPLEDFLAGDPNVSDRGVTAPSSWA
jgi:hypothetical protein